MDEAGRRPTEPPVTADNSDGRGAPGVPPLPADAVNQPKAGSPYALGYRSGLAASPGTGADNASDPVTGGAAMADDSAGSGYAGSGSVYADRPESGGQGPDGAAGTFGSKLESGRHAMRQAAAATSSWFANRAGPQSGGGGAGAGVPETTPQARPQPETRPQPTTWQSAHQSPPGSPSSWASVQTAGAAADPRATGYPGSAAQSWQSRVTGPQRRPDPVRRGRRQAHLTLARVEPWSVMKFSFVASIVAFIILFVAITVLYMVLSALGVFDSLQHTVSTITSSQNTAGTDISSWFSASRILGYTGLLGALNIVLITALSTIGAVIYNLIAQVFGGIEVTLRETD